MTKVESMASMNDGRWPPVARRFEHTSTVSPASGRASRSTRSGCSPVMCTTAPRIMAVLRVVEVGHETDASAGDPDADADDREAGVLDVPPLAAISLWKKRCEASTALYGLPERQPRFSAQR